MIAIAAVAGYALGSLPTAGALGRLWGVNLRESGSGNPGANNALRLGGPVLAAIVLSVEIVKGLTAVIVGVGLAGEPGAVGAGISAVIGNVYNLWYRFDGGKGLGISAGVMAGLWPLALAPVAAVLWVLARLTGSSGTAAIAAMVLLNCAAFAWWLAEWPTGWGMRSGPLLVIATLGIGATIFPKHRAEAHLKRLFPR